MPTQKNPGQPSVRIRKPGTDDPAVVYDYYVDLQRKRHMEKVRAEADPESAAEKVPDEVPEPMAGARAASAEPTTSSVSETQAESELRAQTMRDAKTKRPLAVRLKAFFYRFRQLAEEKERRSELSGTAMQATEKKKQRTAFFTVVIIFVAVCVGLAMYAEHQAVRKPKPSASVTNSFRMSPSTVDKQSFENAFENRLEGVASKLQSVEATLAKLSDRLKKAEKSKTQSQREPAPSDTVAAGYTTAPPPDVQASLNGLTDAGAGVRPRLGHLVVSTAAVEKRSTPAVRRYRPRTAYLDEPIARNRARGESAYLPAGTFARAVVLSGVTAPTGGNAMSNPIPLLLQLTDLAQLPNDFRSHVERCFVTANATGDLSSERVWVRLDRLSCMNRSGKAVDVKVQGYVTGDDGKTGVRARLVTRSGQAIANALFLGAVNGIGKAVSLSAQSSTTYSNGNREDRYENAWRGGLGKGVDDATTRIMNYYIRLADKIFPVLELDSGRQIDVVLSQGVTVDPDSDVKTVTKTRESAPKSLTAREFGEQVINQVEEWEKVQ